MGKYSFGQKSINAEQIKSEKILSEILNTSDSMYLKFLK